MRYRANEHAARSTTEYVFHQLLPYLGNKRHLLDLIATAVRATGCTPGESTFVDAFAGSGVVARLAKKLGFAVVANDWEPYARVINSAALLPRREPELGRLGGYRGALHHLNALPGIDGWIANTLCPAHDEQPDPDRERMFYRRANGRRMDAIRECIANWQQDALIDEAAACCLLTSLLYQACWLANTSGVFKGFHRGWGGSNGTALHRILADIRLLPLLFCDSDRDHRIESMDALQLPQHLEPKVDICYFDPPYNQHPYASNYHVLNSIVVWDQPQLPPATARGSKAAIRRDWQERRSAFNDRRRASDAFAQLLGAYRSRHMLVSYSTDGLIELNDLLATAAARGRLTAYCRSYKRYRTSPTRPSPRPRNVEFVLHIACDEAPRKNEATKARNAIMAAAAASR
ncbi:MAG: DNA adenine methylase [Planctomycetota bacterium]